MRTRQNNNNTLLTGALVVFYFAIYFQKILKIIISLAIEGRLFINGLFVDGVVGGFHAKSKQNLRSVCLA